MLTNETRVNIQTYLANSVCDISMTITGVAGNLRWYVPFFYICMFLCSAMSYNWSVWGMQRSDSMMTSSNGNIFRVTGHLCGNSPVTGEFHAQRPVTRSFDVFFDLRLNKRLSKQSRDWWFDTPSRPLWRHCNDYYGWHGITIYMVTSPVNWLYDPLLRGWIRLALISFKAVLKGRHGDTLVMGNQ